MGQALQVAVELTQIVCGCCAGTYAIAERVREHHQERGTGWHCPYCQVSWGYFGKGTLAEAQRALAEEKNRHARTLARLNDVEVSAAKLTRKLKRVEKGVCPECNRTFTNLERHMTTRHAKGELIHVGHARLPSP